MRALCYQQIPEAAIGVFGAPPVDGLGTAGGFKLMVEDRGSQGPQTLQQMTDALVERGNHQPGLLGLFTLFRSNTPQLYVDIDRTKVKSLGVAISDVFNTLQVYMGSLYVNNFNQFGRSWQVDLQAEGTFRNRVPEVGKLKVRNDKGQMVPMNTVAAIRDVPGPVMVTRYKMFPAAPINGNVAPGTSSGQAVAMMDRLAQRGTARDHDDRMDRADVAAEPGGQHGHVRLRPGRGAGVPRAGRAVRKLVAAAGRDPGGADVPACARSPAWPWRRWTSISSRRSASWSWWAWPARTPSSSWSSPSSSAKPGRSPREATLEACRLRLRPIIMTSLAFILGVVPLVIAEGAGAEMRRTLGTAVFSGMLGVTLFGIFLTPVFFYVIDRLSTRS